MDMQRLTKAIALLGCIAVIPAEARPVAISAINAGAQVYEFYILDAAKLSKIGLTVGQEFTKLTTQLAPFGIKPCQIATDLNGTGVSCGDTTTGTIRFSSNEFFTYNNGFELPGSPIPANQLDAGVNKRYGSNFLAPTVIGDLGTPGRPFTVHFSHRVAQFGMLVDGPNGSIGGVQFIVNHQPMPIIPLVANTPTFVGVEDTLGFTDVTVIPSGGQSMTFVADQFSFLLQANF